VIRSNETSHRDEFQQLFWQAKAGDREALGDVIRIATRWARRYAVVWCEIRLGYVNEADIDDAMQQAALDIIQDLPKFRKPWWACNRARYTMMQYFGRLKREQLVPDTSPALATIKAGGNDLDNIREEERVDFWRQRLQERPDRTRQILGMMVFDGLRPPEIARRLGISNQRVRQIVRERLPRQIAELQSLDDARAVCHVLFDERRAVLTYKPQLAGREAERDVYCVNLDGRKAGAA
jgi:RNA polymerase sigma factor (sigma-70 family)